MICHALLGRAWHIIIQRKVALAKMERSDVFLEEGCAAVYYFWASNLLLCLPVSMPFFLRDVV
jgi:hypothetical protein